MTNNVAVLPNRVIYFIIIFHLFIKKKTLFIILKRIWQINYHVVFTLHYTVNKSVTDIVPYPTSVYLHREGVAGVLLVFYGMTELVTPATQVATDQTKP
jgi:hypothetical protein